MFVHTYYSFKTASAMPGGNWPEIRIGRRFQLLCMYFVPTVTFQWQVVSWTKTQLSYSDDF